MIVNLFCQVQLKVHLNLLEEYREEEFPARGVASSVPPRPQADSLSLARETRRSFWQSLLGAMAALLDWFKPRGPTVVSVPPELAAVAPSEEWR